MKSKAKIKIIIVLGIFIAFSTLNNYNLNFKAGNRIDFNFEDKILKISAVSEKIHIDNNWTAAESAGICTGNGIYSDPYVIEDLVIDGGGSGSCILIENSNVYFKIENCTLQNSGVNYAGIELRSVNKGLLINNNVSINWFGIRLDSSINNTISGNTASENRDGISLGEASNYNTILGNNPSYNYDDGLALSWSNYNTVSGNTANNNSGDGILLYASDYNNISGNILNYNIVGISLIDGCNDNLVSGNIMNRCGLTLMYSLTSNDIDMTNLVNGKPLYYYTNEVNLGVNDFLNGGQVILVNCNDSLISNLNVSYSYTGISLYFCNNNNITGNTASNNYKDGIYLEYSDYNDITENTANNNDYGICLIGSNNNDISGNTLIGNYECIVEIACRDNRFSNNTCPREQPILGYNVLFLLGILSVVIIFISKKLKKS